jgi:hypothetical protein
LFAFLGLIVAISLAMIRGDTDTAGLLILSTPAFAVALSWNWTGLVFAPFEWAKRYIDGAEGGHRHEWYGFKGQRVRVFLDAEQQPWFACNEIAFLLGIDDPKTAFRSYAPHEYGTPESASERCLSEAGLRRLIKYSTHPDAVALGVWLERDVLRMLRNTKARQSEHGAG